MLTQHCHSKTSLVSCILMKNACIQEVSDDVIFGLVTSLDINTFVFINFFSCGTASSSWRGLHLTNSLYFQGLSYKWHRALLLSAHYSFRSAPSTVCLIS